MIPHADRAVTPAPTARLQVTYVVGSSHSGSTLVALLADQHPDVASVGEVSVKRGIRWERRTGAQPCSCGLTIDNCPFWQDLFADVTAAGTPFTIERWRTDYRFEHPWLDALLTRETSFTSVRRARGLAMRRLPVLGPRNARIDRTNLAFIRAVLKRQGASVFLDTSKLLTRLTYLLDVPALEIRVVRLVRDARGFAASAKRRGESTERAARIWRNDQAAIDAFLAERPGLRIHLLRYEDLCARPVETLRALWAFCGVPEVEPKTVIQSSEHHILGNRMRMGGTFEIRLDDTWRSRLDADEERGVLAVAGAVNERLGYTAA
jgi:hypothetical protein